MTVVLPVHLLFSFDQQLRGRVVQNLDVPEVAVQQRVVIAATTAIAGYLDSCFAMKSHQRLAA